MHYNNKSNEHTFMILQAVNVFSKAQQKQIKGSGSGRAKMNDIACWYRAPDLINLHSFRKNDYMSMEL
ncbi:hypothetical protein B0I21_1122 [Sphingobacterium paludis]|uniref:Uncharacterized protein n=1 Tax=Sphingobacterium paludis TaxID=1476465 RepID=A0A4R7CT46_9SPHI|nr:hypothetical protein B0I21_1122 [Sphingobacterium paludis]